MVCFQTCFHWKRNAPRDGTRGAATMNPACVRPYDCLCVTIVKSCVLALVSSAYMYVDCESIYSSSLAVKRTSKTLQKLDLSSTR